jgi:hypothetical protein
MLKVLVARLNEDWAAQNASDNRTDWLNKRSFKAKGLVFSAIPGHQVTRMCAAWEPPIKPL